MLVNKTPSFSITKACATLLHHAISANDHNLLYLHRVELIFNQLCCRIFSWLPACAIVALRTTPWLSSISLQERSLEQMGAIIAKPRCSSMQPVGGRCLPHPASRTRHPYTECRLAIYVSSFTILEEQYTYCRAPWKTSLEWSNQVFRGCL